MKKSEMINIISQVIRTTESIHINELSKKVLEAIEELDMLPPYVERLDKWGSSDGAGREWEEE